MKLALLVIALLFPLASLACQCNYDPLGQATVDRAQQVFAFQLVSARYDPASGDVIGDIRVVESLRGMHQGRQIRYSTSICCGTRLDVGQFYVGFEDVPADEFVASPGNVLDVGEGYSPQSPTIQSLRDVLSRAKTWSQALGESANERVLTLPPPPGPCPGK